jgi:lipopolysaccharide biosynthesis glycosyltransferase
MLLMNIDEIKKTSLLEDAFDYFANNYHKFVCRDQDILNGIWDGKVVFVSEKFNTVAFNKDFMNPLIYHFTGFTKKPWKYFAKDRFREEWIGYLQEGPYRKTFSEYFLFRLKGALSKVVFFIKDPTHKKYYIMQLFGIKFGLGKKDDKRK